MISFHKTMAQRKRREQKQRTTIARIDGEKACYAVDRSLYLGLIVLKRERSHGVASVVAECLGRPKRQHPLVGIEMHDKALNGFQFDQRHFRVLGSEGKP